MAKTRPRITPRKPIAPAPDPLQRFVDGGRAVAAGSKSQVQRADGRELRRITVYLPVDMARKLLAYCGARDAHISDVIADLVRPVVG